MLRRFLAVVLGITLAVGLVSVIEYLGHQVYPIPQGLNVNDTEAMALYVASLPLGALAFVLASWAIGTLAGGWLAAVIAGEKHYLFAGIVGVLMLAGSIMTLVAIVHPTWFAVTGIVLIVLMVFTAARIAAK
jgi:hypothetical protein